MFGGLEIKGTSLKDADDDQTSEAAATTSTTTSSFGFMNADAPEQPTPSLAPEVSSFSFMNPTPTTIQDPELDTPPPAPATSSGFSFMKQEFSSVVVDPVADVSISFAASTASTAASGFDLTTSPAVESAVGEKKQKIPEEASVPAPSGFSFLSEDSNTIPISTSTSSILIASSPTPSSFGLEKIVTAAPTGLPAGAGITFGTSAKRNVVKKKKMRSSKIGMASNHNDLSAMPLPSTTTPVIVTTPPVAKFETTENKSSRSAALEATQRAEAFMQSKALEKANSKETTPTVPVKLVKNLIVPPELQLAASTDEVLMAAKAAAEEAKMLQQNKQHHQKGGGFMGTFFKGFRANPNTISTSNTHKRESSHSSLGSGSNHTNGSDVAASGMDRLTKEQQVLKHAMAERQFQQQPQQQSNIYSSNSFETKNNEDDDEIQVTTSTAGYKSEPIENVATTTTTTTTTTMITTTKATGSSSSTPVVIASNDKLSSEYRSSTQQFTPSLPPTSLYPTGSLEQKKRNTPKEIFEDYQEFFAQSVNRAMIQIKDARNEQKMLSENRFLALAKDRLAAQQIEQIEQQLQEAIDEEDYEQADQLGQELDGHKREKDEVALMLQNIDESLFQLESRKAQLGENLSYCFENLAVRLEELKEKEAANERKDDDETLTQFASISKQISAEQERLKKYSKHLEREEEHVGEERKELEDSIREQTCEIETQKEEVCTNLKEAENEISDLRKELERKVKEAANLRTMMFGFEDSISKVRVKFSRQLTRVDKKEREMKENRNEWKADNELHEKQKEAHGLQVQSHSDTLLSHEEFKSKLKSELQLSKKFSTIIPTQLHYINEKSQTEQAENDDEEALAQLQADVVKCQGAVNNARKIFKIATDAIQTLQFEYDSLLLKIPELQKNKKSAAAERDFKAAGKASKEIKEAESRIKNIEDELNGDAKMKKTSAKDILYQLDSLLSKAKEIAEAKERLSGEKRMTSLAKIIAQLVKKKIENCGECSSEKNSVKAVGASLLQGQILMLQAEGQDLGIKYGRWEELMKKTDRVDGDSSNIEEGKDKTNNLRVEENSEGVVQLGLTSEDRLTKIRNLLSNINDAEEKVQEAAEREDFDEAVEFQDISDKLQDELTELNVTDEELELAMATKTIPPDIPSVQEAEVKETVSEVEEEKKESNEDNDSDLNQAEVDSHFREVTDEDNSDENDIDDGDDEDDNGNDSEDEDEVGVKEEEKNEFIEATASTWSQEEVKNHSREAVDEGERAEEKDNEEANLRKKISSMNINPSLDETKPSNQDDSINYDAEEEHDME